ncbi:fungal-specific transcription factor domain-containing protein [Aspergillus granulosus]|uniref:Fungal-specific transcription factor domain-containing protein n=1 Tax=Aspergillus granulosus TaxID=176169 RepID=A0ABR4GX14_9EURO
MHLARSVLNSARLNDPSIDHISVDQTGASSDAASYQQAGSTEHADTRSAFPSEEVAVSLVDIFFDQYQLQYPIVSQQWLIHETIQYYRSRPDSNLSAPKDIYTAFILQIIFAISLLTISKDNQNDDALFLAERFHSCAMANLTTIMQNKTLETLQCLLLLLLYALLHLSATPIWHISGLSMRMCIDLGLHSESTIEASSGSIASDGDIDSKRRLFWVTYTFDRMLSIMLGRPFTLEDKYIDVAYPDQSLLEGKRKATIHWLKLQRLQSLAVSRFYMTSNEHPEPVGIWAEDMAKALAEWNDEASTLADSSRYTVDWWRYWYHNTLLVLHRPSPSNPALNPDGLSTCYAAAKNVIEASFIRLHTGLLDFVCVDLHYQFMAGITLLFLVWNSPDIRKKAIREWISFKSCLVQWELVLDTMATRWARASRAKEVVNKLSNATVDIVEREIIQSTNSGRAADVEKSRMATRDQDRVRFIMQQLGPLSSHYGGSSNSIQKPTPVLEDTLSPATESRDAVSAIADTSHRAHSETRVNAYMDNHKQGQQQGYPYLDPVSKDSFLDEPMLTDETSMQPQGLPWQETDFAQLSQTLMEAFNPSFLQLPQDLSAISGGNFWPPDINPPEVAYMPESADGYGLFPNFGSGSGSILEDIWIDNEGRARNMAWADSVLNFPEDWENR